jgi:hypothetical protein
MTLRKLLRVVVGLLLIFAVIVGLASINHPILLKWVAGSARLVGRPIKATVYANGRVNKDIKVYQVDEYWDGEPANYYILYFSYADSSRLKILRLNKQENFAGVPSSTSIRDYDIVTGLLFQGEVGSKFSRLQDDIKGLNFDPQLTFTDKQITLNIPPTAIELKCDSLRVVL